MKYIDVSRSHSIFLSFILLFTAFLPIKTEGIRLSALEQAEVMENPDAVYICLDSSVSDIRNIIFELSKLDKDKKSPLHSFKRYLRSGFNIGLYDEVMHVLEYAELVVQKKTAEVGKSKIKPIAKKLAAIIQRVINKELHYDVRAIQQQSQQIEEVTVEGENNAEHRVPTIVFNENIKIEDSLIVKKDTRIHGSLHGYNDAQFGGQVNVGKSIAIQENARIHGSLRVHGSASFKNKAIFEDDVRFRRDVSIRGHLSAGTITAQTIDVADVTVTAATINSLSVTDATITNLEVTNCIPGLCVNNFSVVNETVTGTLSVNDLALTGGLIITDLSVHSISATDAVITNLEVVNCVPSLCVENLTVVNGSVNGTLSINDAVIQTLNVPGGVAITNLSLNSLSATDAVIDTLKVRSCVDSLCVNTLSVTDGIVVHAFNTPGVVHNDGSGNLTTSLVVDGDIASGTITNDKLADATSADVINTLVLRDGSGNFATNMITIDGTVTNPTDAATKQYVDNAIVGLDPKAPAVVVATTNKVLSGLQTIDGVSLVANNRVLLVAQSFPVQNGLWLAQSGAWTRPADFASGTTAGEAYVLILSGTVNAGSSWLCTTPNAIIDTNPVMFVMFSLPDSTTGANVGAGTGLIFRNKTGNTINFKSLIAGTNVTISNNANDITLGVNATSGNTFGALVQRDGAGNFTATTINANLVGNASSATNFSGPLSGQVTGTQSATIVNSVGGQSAANVAAATIAANGATSTNTNGAIVRRDGAGNFSATTITANLIGNATSTTNFSGSLAGNVTGTQGATVVSFVGGQSAANVAAATVLANGATSTNTANRIVQRDGAGNFSATTITANLIGNATSTTNFSGSLLGDVTGTQSATVVSFVGGQSAANVAAATVLANGATNTNIANRIVQRDGAGNFSAGTITANLIGNATSTTNFSGSLAGNVTGTQGATVVSFVGTQSAANVVSATIAANGATNANTFGAIVKRDGAGNFTATTITANLIGNATSTTNFSGPLAGDVTGTQSATVVSFVGGQSAANVASAVSSVSTATSLATGNTLVERNGLGNFAAGTITATLNGNASTASSTTSFTGPLVGDVTGTQGATVVSMVGGQTAANVALATIAANGATNLDTNGAIVMRDGSGNFSATTITAALNGNASGFTGSLVGDVTGTQSATVVSMVGGQTAANVALATIAANAATSVNTDGAIVQRNASGNFDAGTITATLIGNASGFTGSLAGDVTGIQSATVVSFVGGQSATNVAAATVLANAATSVDTVSTIVKRDGSGNFSIGGITFAAGGSTLGYYLTGFGNVTFNANTGTPATLTPNVVYSRIGNVVTVTIAATSFTAAGPGVYTAATALPATLFPDNGSAQIVFAPLIGLGLYDAVNMGTVTINTSGIITISKDANQVGTWSGVNNGWNSLTVTYCV